jgi:UPF0755 protein
VLGDFKDRSNQRVLIFVALLLIVVTLGLREVANRPQVYSDFPAGESQASVEIVVEEGDTGEEIARKLDRAGVIDSWQVFFKLAINDARAERIAPGSYLLDTRIPASQALNQLLDPKRIQGLITLRDGVRLSEIQQLLTSLGYAKVEEILETTPVPEGFKARSLEGYLYPARYSFEPGTSTEEVVLSMLRRFNAAIEGLEIRKNDFDLAPEEIITIASLIEAEGTPDVFTKVSRVIHNRLEKGMALQLDSTVHYLQGSRGEISLTLDETKVNSPYNTYRVRGLPPGPIGSPTRAAIEAALKPERGNWTYFITVAPLETRFTNSYEEFLEWKRLYRENYRKGLFDD